TNRARLEPWFWWAGKNNYTRFKFIFNALVIEKIAKVFHELPYNKKFIVRHNGEFAGMVGLDNMCPNAPRAELWYFIDYEHTGQHIASRAVKQVEKFAQEKSVKQIYARTSPKNKNSAKLLSANKYRVYFFKTNLDGGVYQLLWKKGLINKTVEK
ncbi:MAG: GNAT family N-acetyltransferase, partial [Alphaproteobacteria bacterium]|nr:GNAT family N-acetyltransferase [Alphaproteobacteria bacterium]